MADEDRFSGRVRLLADATAVLGSMRMTAEQSHRLACDLARLGATWEPIDWSEF